MLNIFWINISATHFQPYFKSKFEEFNSSEILSVDCKFIRCVQLNLTNSNLSIWNLALSAKRKI